MSIMKNIAALVTASAIAVTSFVEASAASYNNTGNELIAAGEASMCEGIAYNLCDLIEELDNPFPMSVWSYVTADGDMLKIARTAFDDMIDIPVSEYVAKIGASTLVDTIKMAEFCVYAYTDLANAFLDLSAAKREEYNATINTYFNIPCNSCLTISSAILKRVNSGVPASDKILEDTQVYINSLHQNVAYLRNMASKKKYKKYKSELKDMADCLEKLINATNVKAIYVEAWNSRTQCPYFEKSTTCSAAACITMVTKAKGMACSQSEIARIGGSNFNFGAVEKALGLNDNNSYVFLDGHSKEEQMRRITSSISTTNTPGILRLSPIPEDSYRSYILVIGVSNGDLLVVDPFFSGNIETATDYAYRNGYQASRFYQRLYCFWSYL